MKKTTNQPKDQKYTTIRMDRAVVQMAKIVAASRGVTITDILRDAAMPSVKEWYVDLIRKTGPRV
jgi:hypothetical protein